MSENFEIQDGKIVKCLSQNTDIVLPKDITDVDADAFLGTKIKSLIIPNELILHQSKKSGAFRMTFYNLDCETLIFEGKIENLEGVCFLGAKIGKVVLPSNLKRMGPCLFTNGGVEIGEMIIPEGVEEIDDSFFGVKFGKIVFPKSLKTLKRAAFNECIFSDLILDTSIKEIEENTFSDCYARNVCLSADIQLIGKMAFRDSKFERLQLPEHLKKIRRSAFMGTKVKEIILPDTVVRIEKQAFMDCEAEKIVLSPNVKKIELDTFAGCLNLRELLLPEKLESLNMSAISDCPKLKKLTLPSTLKEILCFGVDYNSNVEEVINFSSLEISKKIFPKLKTVINH